MNTAQQPPLPVDMIPYDNNVSYTPRCVDTLNVDDLKWLMLELAPVMCKITKEDRFISFKGGDYRIPGGVKFDTFSTWITTAKPSDRSLSPAGRSGQTFIEALRKNEAYKLSFEIWEFRVQKAGSRYTGSIFLVDRTQPDDKKILVSVVYLHGSRSRPRFNPMQAFNE